MAIAVISGTGFYDLINSPEEIRVATPFGEHSKLWMGRLSGREIYFLNRHSDGHRFAPHEIPYEANIYALKKLGVDRIISTSSTGIINAKRIKVREFVVPDNLYDASGRTSTLYKSPVVVHVSMDEPFCPELRTALLKSAKGVAKAHTKGTYVSSGGPALETPAQIQTYKKFGFDIVGMTVAAEAKLAREAGICYATLSSCDNYAVGISKKLDAKTILESAKKSADAGRLIVAETVKNMRDKKSCVCGDALKDAVISAKKPDLF